MMMQKIDLTDDIEFWMEARLLRNKIAHAYLPEQLKDIYDEIVNKSQTVFDSLERIERYLENAGIRPAQ
jgi:uncharacterized protein with HEPN domain